MKSPGGQPDLPFELQPSSGVPLYRQIVDQVELLVATGRLKPGDLLPSVRSVAKQSDINPMTVSKAYSQLEAKGIVERARGLGMRVLDSQAVLSKEERLAQAEAMLAKAITHARQLGLSEEEIQQIINKQQPLERKE